MKKIISSLLCVLLVATSFAQDNTVIRKKHFNTNNAIAIEGYDPVAYFMQSKAVKGKKEFTYTQQGITYNFSTAVNKELFKINPAKYEPQYGGWCAYAMGNDGTKVEVDPETFKIVDNKLYLFYNKFFTNTLKSWNKNETKLKLNADASWQKTFN